MAQKKKFSRAQGASSGVESYFIGIAGVLSLTPLVGLSGLFTILIAMFVLELVVAAKIDKMQLWYAVTSQKLGPTIVRNASISFAECVRPGGKPTPDHCLSCYNLPGYVTSIMFGIPALILFIFNPAIAFVRIWYPEHQYGVNRNDRVGIYWFLLRHPVAVQGEGPSNGDGLAAMNASETLIYPITPKHLTAGPKDKPYWVEEGKPRFRDFFHDKIFVHRFFQHYGASCPTLVCEVFHHKRREIVLEPSAAPKDLIWKPRYSTMGLGVEKFTGWDDMDNGVDWAPSTDPYIIESKIVSTESPTSEWYRMTTLWDWDSKEPMTGYCWRQRNPKGDDRIQTDIIGGQYCINNDHVPFVGPKEKGMVIDPRTGEKVPLDKKVERALAKACALQKTMHKALGKELHSIGWDVMVVEDEPYFLEFNVNNGFFVADHWVAECEQMAAFYEKNFLARLPGQLLNFDPYA
eukprot:TRINITY_DN49293_c0_g1_i1.p1 TRINITY_DN49293_c0_g1~~TRINITY_DN49293_c0_g1_i1.p1  ORF type:complete len:499 (-),score=99.17 TRINITY_DN49293_c0_g1_i1:624-2009(-)